MEVIFGILLAKRSPINIGLLHRICVRYVIMNGLTMYGSL
jgi:hypothetical protein